MHGSRRKEIQREAVLEAMQVNLFIGIKCRNPKESLHGGILDKKMIHCSDAAWCKRDQCLKWLFCLDDVVKQHSTPLLIPQAIITKTIAFMFLGDLESPMREKVSISWCRTFAAWKMRVKWPASSSCLQVSKAEAGVQVVLSWQNTSLNCYQQETYSCTSCKLKATVSDSMTRSCHIVFLGEWG